MGIASSTLIPEDVLDCLLLILLTAILHPRTTHLNCPDFLCLMVKNRASTPLALTQVWSA